MNENNNDTKETKSSSHVLLKVLGIGIVTGATALSVAAVLTNADVLDRYGLFFSPSITAEAENTHEDAEDIFTDAEEEKEPEPIIEEPEPEPEETKPEEPEEEEQEKEEEPEEEPERTPARG